MEPITIILLVLVVVSAVLAWRTSQKNKQLAADTERFRAITDVEAEARAVKQKLQAENAALQEEVATAKAAHAAFLKEDQEKRTGLEEQYRRASDKYKELKSEIALVEESLEDISFGFYAPHFAFDTAEEYKAEVKAVRDRQRELIRQNSATHTAEEWTVGGSRAEGKKMERQYSKVMLRAFNGECDAAVAKVSWNNVTKIEQRVEKAYADINKLGAVVKMSLTQAYLKEKLNEVRLTHEYEDKKYRDREEQREQRQQMREQEKAERELERAKEEAEREEARDQKALEKARTEAHKAAGQQLEKLTEQIAALERKMGEAHDRKERAIARAQLTKSGFVYVLSNEGAFGKGVVKIGMTRRMEPLDRVKELGDASVPFPFDVHVMMFSENAPELEQALHDHFGERRVNLVNPRKEYFRDVDLKEVEDFIKARGVTAQFIQIAEAREYRETQAALAAKAKNSSPDTVFPESPFQE